MHLAQHLRASFVDRFRAHRPRESLHDVKRKARKQKARSTVDSANKVMSSCTVRHIPSGYTYPITMNFGLKYVVRGADAGDLKEHEERAAGRVISTEVTSNQEYVGTAPFCLSQSSGQREKRRSREAIYFFEINTF